MECDRSNCLHDLRNVGGKNMLTKEPTPEQIQEWKDIYQSHHSSLSPNRKTGSEVDDYFRKKYSYQIYDNSNFKKIVELNIICNEHTRQKLERNKKTNIKCYSVDDVLVGIDLTTGEFHVESENIEKVIQIYDDLFAYRGLDAADLKNYFLVAEYIKLKQE